MKAERLVESKNKTVRVLMVGSSPSVKGGMSNVVTQLLEHEWGQEIQIRYIATHVSGSVIGRCLVFLRGYFAVLYLLLFHSGQVDLVHMHMSYKGSFYRKYLLHLLVKKFGKKDIIHLHGSEFQTFYDTAGKKLQGRIRRMLRECDQILVLGDYWEQAIRKMEPQAKIFILRNAVPIPERQAQWDPMEIRLLFLGVLIPRKGVSDLLQAVRILKDKGIAQKRTMKLVIAGTGEQEQELKKLCASLGLEEIVTFAGWIEGERKRELLLSSQCFILPSYHEGLPIAVLEAIGYGLPVIATDVGSVSDAVLDGVNGFLVPTGSPQSLAHAIEQVTANRDAWQKMHENARQIALERFDERHFFACLQNLYHAVLCEETC